MAVSAAPAQPHSTVSGLGRCSFFSALDTLVLKSCLVPPPQQLCINCTMKALPVTPIYRSSVRTPEWELAISSLPALIGCTLKWGTTLQKSPIRGFLACLAGKHHRKFCAHTPHPVSLWIRPQKAWFIIATMTHNILDAQRPKLTESTAHREGLWLSRNLLDTEKAPGFNPWHLQLKSSGSKWDERPLTENHIDASLDPLGQNSTNGSRVQLPDPLTELWTSRNKKWCHDSTATLSS